MTDIVCSACDTLLRNVLKTRKYCTPCRNKRNVEKTKEIAKTKTSGKMHRCATCALKVPKTASFCELCKEDFTRWQQKQKDLLPENELVAYLQSRKYKRMIRTHLADGACSSQYF